jgi:lysophospholipase L1-like esterase
MSSRTLRMSVLAVAGTVALLTVPVVTASAGQQSSAPVRYGTAATTWVDAWGAAPHSSAAEAAPPSFANQTLRLITRLHAGGSRVRVRLSNTFGDKPVTFGKVTVGRRSSGAAVTSVTSVTFAGKASITAVAGTEVTSDPVGLSVKAGQDLAVSIFLPTATGTVTWHRSALQTSYISKSGNHAGETAATSYPTGTGHWFFLDAVSVANPTAPGTIVALGDSITDGAGSASNANHRWPDLLYGRLAALPDGNVASVVDEGISGNRVLTDDPRNGVSALHRLTRDVLVRRGLRHVVLLEGINDLRSSTPPATAEQIIAGYRQIIDRVHAKNAKILGATLTPVEGSGGYSDAMEQERQKINAFIRTPGNFDGVIDFDKATRDPAHPLRFLVAYDSGDHLHPNDQGYRAMAAAVDLRLFD